MPKVLVEIAAPHAVDLRLYIEAMEYEARHYDVSLELKKEEAEIEKAQTSNGGLGS